MKKFEIFIFIIAFILQDFSFPVGENFGIPVLVIFLLIYGIKRIFNEKYSIKFLGISLIIFFLMLLSSILNNNVNIFKIFKNLMLVLVVLYTYIFIKQIYRHNMEKYFWKIFYIIISILCVYGLYQYIAPNFNAPLFLNIFFNNPSYIASKGMYQYIGGWVDESRVYATFFEPSAWGIFLDIIFINAISNKYITSKFKIVVCIIILLNIYLTYSRSAWGILIYILVLYNITVIILKTKEIKYIYPIAKLVALSMPFINLFAMYIGNTFIFNDSSSQGRTNSAFYYLINSFDSFKSIILGHSGGSIAKNYTYKLWDLYYAESFAHNGYIELIYEYGVIIFILLIYFCIIKSSEKIVDKKQSIMLVIMFSTINCFSSMIYVETILSMLVIFYLYYYYDSRL